ncbi:MAG: hypothetical protein H8E46_08720 [FCB group bacterium]|nr:hypothetical protein [FCB group bacterium]
MNLKSIVKSKRPGSNPVEVTGSIQNVLNAVISPANTVPITPSRTGYSFGLGSIAPNFQAGRAKFGEFLSTPDTMGVLTSGGSNLVETAFSAVERFYTPFNVSIGTEFEETLYLECDKSVTFNSLYRSLFERASLSPAYKGIITVSAVTVIDNFYGSFVKKSAVAGSLENGKIIEPGRFKDWFIVDTVPVYQKHIAVSVGIGLDMKNSKFPQDKLDKIFYLNPGNKNVSDILLHNHCYILPPSQLPAGIGDYNSFVSGIVNNDTIVDVKHILDNTMIESGVVSFTCTQNII